MNEIIVCILLTVMLTTTVELTVKKANQSTTVYWFSYRVNVNNDAANFYILIGTRKLKIVIVVHSEALRMLRPKLLQAIIKAILNETD